MISCRPVEDMALCVCRARTGSHWAILERPIGGISGLELGIVVWCWEAGFRLDIQTSTPASFLIGPCRTCSCPEMAAMVASPGAYTSYDLEKTSFVGFKVAEVYPIPQRSLGSHLPSFTGYLLGLFTVGHDESPHTPKFSTLVRFVGITSGPTWSCEYRRLGPLLVPLIAPAISTQSISHSYSFVVLNVRLGTSVTTNAVLRVGTRRSLRHPHPRPQPPLHLLRAILLT